MSSLRKAVNEKNPAVVNQLIETGCVNIRKDILRADLFTIVPLVIRVGCIGAGIRLTLDKANQSDNLDTKTECGQIMRDIIVAIDDSI